MTSFTLSKQPLSSGAVPDQLLACIFQEIELNMTLGLRIIVIPNAISMNKSLMHQKISCTCNYLNDLVLPALPNGALLRLLPANPLLTHPPPPTFKENINKKAQGAQRQNTSHTTA